MPAPGTAVNVTDLPAGTAARHDASHSVPPIFARTEPEPEVPTLVTSEYAVRLNEAVVDTSAFATCEHDSATPADAHELLQPVNPDLSPGTAVSTTVAPRGTAARQAASQAAPSTVADTEPEPAAFAVTFTV